MQTYIQIKPTKEYLQSLSLLIKNKKYSLQCNVHEQSEECNHEVNKKDESKTVAIH